MNYRSQIICRQTSKAAALAQQLQQQQTAQPAATVPTATAEGTDETGAELQVDDWQPDPNEPRYCLCNQVSYGDMVGCDNEDVCKLDIYMLFANYFHGAAHLRFYVRR